MSQAYCAKGGPVVENNESDYLLWKLLPPCKNDREEDNEFSGQSLLHPVVFQKRIYQVFWSSFGSCPLQFSDQLPCDCVNLGLEILPIL